MSTISAGTTSGTALVTSGDTTGQLVLKTNGTTTALTLGTDQSATFAGNVTVTGSITASGGGIPSLNTPLAVVGNSTAGAEIRLPEDTDNGSNYVALKAPNSLASNLTFTLPTADGSNGQYLQTNGSGQLAFATVPTTSPAGSTGQIQINSGGSFGALSSGTNGQIIVSQGSSNPPTFLAQGSSGQVLTSQGSGSAPTWAAPAVGLNLLGTFSSGGGSTLNVDSNGTYFTSTYDQYLLELYGPPLPAYTSLGCRFYSSGSLISSNSYGTQSGYYASGSWSNVNSQFSQPAAYFASPGGSSWDQVALTMTIWNPAGSSNYKSVYFYGCGLGAGYGYPLLGGIGLGGTTSPFTGIQFFLGSGAGFTATARLYGVKK